MSFTINLWAYWYRYWSYPFTFNKSCVFICCSISILIKLILLWFQLGGPKLTLVSVMKHWEGYKNTEHKCVPNRTEKVFIKMYGSLLQTSIHHKTIITIICDHFSYLSGDAHLLKKMCHVSEQYLTL